MGRFIDLAGQKFGRLTVLYDTGERNRGSVVGNCLCDCGKEHKTTSILLRNGQSKSCGCYKSELASKKYIEHFKKYNDFNITDYDFGVGYTSNGEEFYFDIEDYEKIKDICWSVSKNGYLVGWEHGICYLIHRKIYDYITTNFDIDHINHNKLDNRKTNLRICTRSQNLMNRNREISSYSGIRGVQYNKNNDKYGVFIYVNKKKINLGYYKDINEAIKVRKQAEENYFGEYSYDNSMKNNKSEPSYN